MPKKKDIDQPEKLCVVYARYSSHSQRDVSIEQQVADCEAYAKMNGYRVMKVYADRHISGTTDKRLQFQKMLKDAEKGHWQYVLTWKVDRFARNRYDSATYKFRLKRCGVQVVYAKEAIPDGRRESCWNPCSKARRNTTPQISPRTSSVECVTTRRNAKSITALCHSATAKGLMGVMPL